MPKWMWNVLLSMVKEASPSMKASLCKTLDDLAVEAKKTSNPFDDLIISMAKGMLGCDKE